jgi:hypothetical protein
MITPCLCGKMPERVTGWRDRGMHPAMPWIRYSCSKNVDGHVVVGPKAESPYLGWDDKHPELIKEAERLWNQFIDGNIRSRDSIWALPDNMNPRHRNYDPCHAGRDVMG